MKNKPLKRLTATLTAASVVIAGGLVPITAGAATTTTTFDFDSADDAPNWEVNRFSASLVTESDSSTATASGDKGVMKFTTASNASNGSGASYARARYDFSDLVEGASSYTVSYKLYFNDTADVRGNVGLTSQTLRSLDRYEVTPDGMIGTVGRYTNEIYLRFEPNGERGFLSNRDNNQWLDVSITVNADGTYTYTVTGDGVSTASGTLADRGIADATVLEVAAYNPNSTDVVDMDDLQIKAEFTSESGTSTTLTNNIDFGFGDWSYSGGLSGMTANKDAAVHYSDISLKDELGYGPKSINIPVKSLPGDGSVVYLYSGQEVSNDLASNIPSHGSVTVGDRTVSSFGTEFITSDKGLKIKEGEGYLAKLTFSTKDKKKYVTVETADGPQGEFEIAADGVIEVPVDTAKAAEMFDGTLLMWVKGADKVEPGSYGELSLVYKTKESAEYTVDADVQSASGTRYYFGRLNGTDLNKVNVTAAATGDATTVDIYAVDAPVADFGSGTNFDASAKIGTATIAKGATTGTASISKAPGDNKYIYAVASAAAKETPVAISDVSFGYKSKEDNHGNNVRAQYLLQNTTIDTSKVMVDGTFNEDYYKAITAVLEEVDGCNAASITDDKCMADYFNLKESLAGWKVVESIEKNLNDVYNTVNGLEEDKKYEEANKSRDAIESVQGEYEALTSTTAQKFVGAVNYSKLSTLYNILADNDAETIAKYNDAIALVWDTENDKSTITQDNYLVYSKQIKDVDDLARAYDSLPQSVKSQMEYDGDKLASIYDTIMKDVDNTFIPKTAEDFTALYNETAAVYNDPESTFEQKQAAVYADDISALYNSIHSSAFESSVAEKIGASYETYQSWRAGFDKYGLVTDFIGAVGELRTEIDKAGVSADTYENIADLYYTALDKQALADAVTDSDFANLAPELDKQFGEAKTYLDLAVSYMSETAESITKAARDAINSISENAENTVAWVSSVKIARYRYDALKTNAKKYVDNADMNADKKAYGEILAGYEETMAGYEEENINAMQKLYDEKAQDCLDYAASLTYDSTKTDIEEYTTDFYNAAKAYDDVNKKINGTVSLNKDGEPVVNDGAKSAIFTSIENTYNVLYNYKKAIDDFYSKGQAYANAIQAEIDLIYNGQGLTYADINEYTEDAIKGTLDSLYPDTIFYYDTSLVEYGDKGQIVSDGNGDAAKNTKAVRDAANAAKKAYDNAKAEFEKQYTNATGKTNGFDPEAEYAEPWVNNTVEAAYTKLDNLIESKLKAEFDEDMAIEAAREEVENAAKAEVDRLTGLIEELYNKISTTPYTDEASIDADRTTYDSLVNAVNTAKQNMNFIYQDENGETTNYFTKLYPSSADSMLAYIDSSLDQWKSAWSIIESANALDISLVYNETEGKWYVNDATDFDALKTQYDESIDVIQENVNSVISSFFTDKATQIANMSDAADNYANAINAIPNITSTTLYGANVDKINAVNAYVKGLNDTVASEDAETADKANAQAKLDIIASTFDSETTKLTAMNTTCEIIKPAYDFDAKVNEAKAINDNAPVDTAALKSALDEATKMYAALSADSVNYVQQYALYTKLMNSYPASGYETFIDDVNALENVVYNSDESAMTAFMEGRDATEGSDGTPAVTAMKGYNELLAAYNGFTSIQQSAVANSKQVLDSKKAQYDTVAAAKAEADAINTANLAIYSQYNGKVTVENYDAAKAAYDGAVASMEALDAKYPNYGTEENPIVASDAVQTQLEGLAGELADLEKVVETVDLINAIGTVTENSGAAIMAARDSFDALTAEQQLMVSNYAVLVEAEKAYAAFDSVQEAIEAANAVNALINAVPNADEITAENVEDAKAKAEAAREAFNALNDTAKLYVTDEDKLTAAEEKIAELTRPSQDVDGDGVVNTIDFNMVLQMILGRGDSYTDVQKSACDVNGDGNVNVFDLIEIVANWD